MSGVIVGGFFNEVQGLYNAIIGGTRSTILTTGGTSHYGNVIIGGQYNQIPASISGSVVLGGNAITASVSNTVFYACF